MLEKTYVYIEEVGYSDDSVYGRGICGKSGRVRRI